MSELEARDSVRASQVERRVMLGRLQRVNEALSRWDEYDAAQEIPEDIRPQVEPPTLSRKALKELQQMLADCIGELEAAWERRN